MPIITHGDLDGFVSALIAMQLAKVAPNKIWTTSYGSDRDERFQRLLSDQIGKPHSLKGTVEQVWITDVSLRPGELEWVRNKNRKSQWIWVDHHPSSVDFDPKGIFDQVHVPLITGSMGEGLCAADIMWDLYKQSLDHRVTPDPCLEAWVQAAHDRDLWINENRLRGQKLDLMIKKAIREKRYPKLLVLAKEWGPTALINGYPDWWRDGIKQYQDSCVIAAKTRQRYKINNEVTLVVCYASGSVSDVAETLYDDDSEVVAMIQVYDKEVVINLRTRHKDVNLAEMAKALFSGGGHAPAAGGRLQERHWKGGFTAVARDVKRYLEPEKPKTSSKPSSSSKRKNPSKE